MSPTLDDVIDPQGPVVTFTPGPWPAAEPDASDALLARLGPALLEDPPRLVATLLDALGAPAPAPDGATWDALLDALEVPARLACFAAHQAAFAPDGPAALAPPPLVVVLDAADEAIARARDAFGALAAVVAEADRRYREHGVPVVLRLVAVWSDTPAHAPPPRVPARDDAWLEAFAEEWVAAWNARDLARILSHYHEAIVFHSPLAAQLVPESGGVIRGKPALRAYWTAGLARSPDLHFTRVATLRSAGGLTILYHNHRGQEVAETLLLDAAGLVVHGVAAYGPRRAP